MARGAAGNRFFDLLGEVLAQGIILIEVGSAAYHRVVERAGPAFGVVVFLAKLGITYDFASIGIQTHRPRDGVIARLLILQRVGRQITATLGLTRVIAM